MLADKSQGFTVYKFIISLLALTFLTACSDDDGGGLETPVPPLSTMVELNTGTLEGTLSDRAAAWAYRSIPYAEPPLGELRWKAPRPASSWQGVRPAAELPEFCPQFLYFTEEYAGSEDCLYLNVYRPATPERDLPVFLWIHGGGNNNGDTGQEFPVYDGARLAERGNMVVVTVQYRLGALGWLYHPALTGDQPGDGSGNYGTLDIIAALEWIQDNAGAFGGDAGNVTIAGNSAGAGNVLTLVISDLAQDLFHRAIVQSLGGWPTDAAIALEQSNTLIADLAANANLPAAPQSNEEIEALLRGTDPQTLLSLANTSQIFADGEVIPREGYELLSRGDYPNKVPIIIGTNKDEYKLNTNPLGFNEYPNGSDELREAVGRYRSDAWRVSGADEPASQLVGVADQPPVYVYRFNWGSPDEQGRSPLPGNFGATGGAFHSGEISFMMGNEDIFIFNDFTPLFFLASNAASRTTMADIMVSYWSRFAATGDPNGNSLPAWEPWSNSEGGFKAVNLDVNFDDNSPRVEPDTSIFTEAGVYAEAREKLSGPILEEVLSRLDEWFAPRR